jgi:hypothetical protein
VLFVFLSRNEVNPIKRDFNGIQKLNMITNDMQQFNKNLFGLTIEEEQYREKINMLEMNSNYKMIKNVKEKKILDILINEYMTTKVDDTYHLTCLIIGLVNTLLYEKKKIFM